jgi:S-adenosylmethionine decarboxylase
MNALARLGMVSESPSENQTIVSSEKAKDYFVERDGQRFAGMHLLIDLWGAKNLDSPALIDTTLCAGAVEAGATILHSHFHHFTPNGGVSGVVVLAESHISIHTWPERDFAALDVFMCGNCDPYKVIPFLKAAFTPDSVEVGEQRRGLVK